MAFNESQFPVTISYGSKGGPGLRTDVITVDSGAEQRISRWASARRSYDVSYGIKSLDQLTTVQRFFITMAGAASGFRYKDWLDFTTASNGRDAPTKLDEATDPKNGDGSNKTFQIVKRYAAGSVIRTRNLTKPVSGTTLVAIDGVNQASGWSIDLTTGLITFDAAPASDEMITAGCEFDVPVRFGEGVDSLLAASIDDFDTGNLGSVPLIEIKDALDLPEEFFYGGAVEFATGGDTTLSVTLGRLYVFDNTQATADAALPDPTNLPPGGPYFYVVNESGTFTLTIKDHLGATLVNVATGEMVLIVLSQDTAGAKVWYAK